MDQCRLFYTFASLVFIGVLLAGRAEAGHTFSGIDLRDGKSVSIVREDKTKKATVLIFLSAKCPCSASHADEIKSLATEFPEFRFIGVNSNSDESAESAQAYFSALSLSFPVLKDEKTMLANEFKAVKTPHAFILDSDQKIVFQGGVSNSAIFPRADRKYLREALEDMKNGREIRTPLARALGCAIAR